MDRKSDGSVALFAALFCWLVSAVILLFVCLIAWTFKDGLGPVAADSHGRLAMMRFWTEVRWKLPFPIAVVMRGCAFYAYDRRRNSRASASAGATRP